MASIVLEWNANPPTDNITDYQVWGANGTGVAFGSCSLLATVDATTWTDTGIANGQARTYYIVAQNAVGSSSPDGPLNITAAGASGVYVINLGGAPSAQEGTHAARPAPGHAGALYVETDTKSLFRDNGSSWDLIAGGGALADAGWFPLVNGAEPPALVSDGAGQLIAITYAP